MQAYDFHVFFPSCVPHPTSPIFPPTETFSTVNDSVFLNIHSQKQMFTFAKRIYLFSSPTYFMQKVIKAGKKKIQKNDKI